MRRRRADGQTGRVLVALVLCVCASARPRLQAQQVIDRIAAMVGDKPILLSEVDERIGEARGQGMQVPTDSAQLQVLRLQMLGSMIDEELVYQEAKRDTSIVVTDQEVQAAVEQQYQQVRRNFATDAAFRTALQNAGLGTPEEYHRYLADQQRHQAFVARYIDHQRQEGKLRAGTVSETEMRQYFDNLKSRGQLPKMPASITFKQIIISPRPTVAEKAVAYQRADSIRAAIEKGADFAEMARRFSDDPTSKVNGGDLGWFRRGMMVRPFEEVAFSLRPGVPSPVTETEYGFHIIQVDRVQPGQVKARHILIAPVVTDSERARQRVLADSVAQLLRSGISADTLAKQFGDSGELVSVGPSDRAQLPAGYSQALATAQQGQVVGPVALNPETPDRPRFLIAQVTSVLPEHDASFEDKREEIRSVLLDQRGLKNLVDDLRRRTYVSVRL